MAEDAALASPLARARAWLADYRPGLRARELGVVQSVGDGIAWVAGLPSAAMDELLRFEDGSLGQVFQLSEARLGAVLLHQSGGLAAGTRASLGGRVLDVPVGDGLLGRVVDPLGRPLDGDAPPQVSQRRPLEAPAPPLLERDFVTEPLLTGSKIIDTMLPIGRGQRQLIIGDEGTGRSALALDAVLNQKDSGVRCVYVLIGQKRSAVVGTLELLRDQDALAYTTVVVGEASALPGLQYLAPFAGCTLAEAWMHAGHDTLVVYDDLSAHARAYRELSLLLRRPPGREAYPGDIFYLHARLLERATHLSPEAGGGSMTALPIVETQQGEIAAYIPTNLISITDGQIYLDAELFAGGFRPAIDIALSVSRIGGKAQHLRIREAAGSIKLEYLQFQELELFTRFGARLEPAMQARLARGRVLRELLKQERLAPVSAAGELAWLLAFNNGLLEDLPPAEVAGTLARLLAGIGGSGLDLRSPDADWLAWLQSALVGAS
jgi:F-type H+-transporting ATPase subunit alpha